jgi:DNA-binding HxlR family transcriptional regulator
MTGRSFHQWCGLAEALDRIGDRWTLLIVRELLLGPKRYTDLRRNLPGIATNLLAERLRDLDEDGLVTRRELPPPTPASVYELTETGRALEEPILALIRWGGRFLPAAPATSVFRGEWLALALKAVLMHDTPGLSLTLNIETDELPIWVQVNEGLVTSGVGARDRSELTVRGDVRLLLGVVTGAVPLEHAQERGLVVEGSARARRKLATLVKMSRAGEPTRGLPDAMALAHEPSTR